MPHFRYKAVDRSGKVHDNYVVEAETEGESISRLRNAGMTPVKFVGIVGTNEEGRSGGFFTRKSIDACDFTNRLVPLLVAQIPLERALGIIEEGMENERSKAVVSELRRGLHEGKRFSSLIRDRGRNFPGMYANMVEAGEESGALNGVMKELQKFLNDSKEMKEFLITSSIYPAIILSVTCAVTILLFTVFIPKFSKIFVDLHREMPLPTKIMMGISAAMTSYWWMWSLVIFLFIFVIHQIKRGGRLRDLWDDYVIKLPVIGKLVMGIEITRFVRTLAVLITNHVHLLESIRIAERIIQNRSMRQSLGGVATELKGGTRLSSALEKSAFIPNTVVRMLNIGEETGNMGEMLDNVAKQYEDMVKQQIKRLLALFEPAVILFLAMVVMLVVLSMFTAILQMNEI